MENQQVDVVESDKIDIELVADLNKKLKSMYSDEYRRIMDSMNKLFIKYKATYYQDEDDDFVVYTRFKYDMNNCKKNKNKDNDTDHKSTIEDIMELTYTFHV